MRTSLNYLLRLCGGILFGVLGWALGNLLPFNLPPPIDAPIIKNVLLALILGLIGIYLFPKFLQQPINTLIERLTKASLAQVLADFIGLVIGLVLSALLVIPLTTLPEPFRNVIPALVAVVFAFMGVTFMNARYKEVFQALNIRLPGIRHTASDLERSTTQREQVLLDTSVIIDGRIADICATGFVRGDLVIPRFVLNELQYIADDNDTLRRTRGRRGLETLNQLQRESPMIVKIVDDDFASSRQVDEKLVMLAKQRGGIIMTNDYNLNKVASIQGVTVLNINELTNAVKSVMLPGEKINVAIVQEGKEAAQGVGYLDDGTMVVVDDGRRLLNKTVSVTVTKVLQTAAGRMIFAKG
jgi:uncharacterized protein YacL